MVVMVVIVVNEISVPLYNHVSSQSLHYFILLWLYTLYLSHQVHATARSRGFISSWFQDLAGNKPLTVLVKKVSATKWINVPKKKEKLENLKYQWGQKHGKMIISVSSVCCCCCFCVFIFYKNGQINVTLIMKVNVIKLEQS